MKKITSFILCLIMVFSLLAPGVSAENTLTTIEVAELKSVSLSGITLPAADKKVPEDPTMSGKIKILVTRDGQQEEITAVPFTGAWTEKDDPGKSIKGTNFVPGKTYRLTVTLEFQDVAPEVKDSAKFTVEKEDATYLSTKGQKILFCCDFVADAGDITPKVSVEASGNKSKTYDGKETVLTAKVEKMDGVSYSYQWQRGGSAISGETAETIKLKNVSQSGEYTCKVTATAGSTTQSAQSSSVKIDITPLTVIIKIDDVKKEMFQDDPKFTYTVKGEIYDELVGKVEREDGEEVGEYEIGIGTLAFKAGVAENYEIQAEPGKLVIEAGEDLPLVPLKSFADTSYIVGKNDAKIKIYVTKGSLPEDSILTLSLPETGAKEKLEKEKNKKVLKSFSLSLVDEEGKAIDLPKHAKVLIPITEKEEKAYKLDTITAVLFDKKINSISTSVEKDGKISYIAVEVEEVGTIALFEGKEVAVKNKTDGKKDNKKGGAFLWILIAVSTLLSVGAIFFTVWQIRKTDQKPDKNEKKAPLTPEEIKEKERRRQIAEELNSLPPVPENAPETKKIPTVVPTGDGSETRTFSAVETEEEKTIIASPIPEMDAEKTIVVDPIPETNAEKTIQIPEEMPTQISFEDLED